MLFAVRHPTASVISVFHFFVLAALVSGRHATGTHEDEQVRRARSTPPGAGLSFSGALCADCYHHLISSQPMLVQALWTAVGEGGG